MLPICLKIENKKCLVIGGGLIAEQKINLLLKQHAQITCIAPQCTDTIIKLAQKNIINVLNRTYELDDEDGYFLVVAATNNKLVNRQIFENCSKKNILINSVDDAENGNYFFTSVIERGKLLIAISTSGKLPYLSKRLKQYIENVIPNKIAVEIEQITLIRDEIIKKYENNKILKNQYIEEKIRNRIDNIFN